MLSEDNIRALEAVPVFQSPAGTRYVRASDIPNAIRPQWERWAVGVHSPDLPGERAGDPIHEDDFLAWLQILKA